MKSVNNKIESTGLKKDRRVSRRQALAGLVFGTGVVIAIPARWSKPVVDAVLLPAHAQTSEAMCVTDTTVGGPLIGHPSGATTCQEACEAEANSRNAELCNVIESVDVNNATQCDCELDLPD